MLPERDGCPWSVSADSFHGNAEFAEVCGPEPAAPTLFLRRHGKPVSYEISDLIPVVAVFQPDLQPAVVGRIPLAPPHLALDNKPSVTLLVLIHAHPLPGLSGSFSPGVSC